MNPISSVSRTTSDERNERPHVFFDMDGTLTESRSVIDVEMLKLLTILTPIADVSIISGATIDQMWKQVPQKLDVHRMAQSGNETYVHDKVMWINKIPYALIPFIEEHIKVVMECELFKNAVKDYVIDAEDQVEFRGAQVSFSFIGHNADREVKAKFDPYGLLRQEIILSFPVEHEDIEVRVGGTTCLDYTRRGWNKAGNIQRLMAWRGWTADKCVYVGDALRPGGNDEVMLGVMTCVPTTGPTETMEIIRSLIAKFV